MAQYLRKQALMDVTIICLVVWCHGLGVVSTPGTDYLDRKETDLDQIAQIVRDNAARQCELLKTCACSRHACSPLIGDIQKPMTCLEVKNSKYCPPLDGNGTCHWKKFDYTQSFVRTAPTTERTSRVTTVATCAQRELDGVFRNISKPDELSRVYIGLNDGTWRVFPGSDISVDECGGFETRTRPWYRDSTSVRKVVVILIDAGQSMGTTLEAAQGQGTILNAAIIFTEEFLKSLNELDNVNIIMFNSTNATPLSASMVTIRSLNKSDTTIHPELDPLRQSLGEQMAESSSQSPSNVTKGINLALSQFGTNYPRAVKVIICLTDGQFATASNVSLPTSELVTLNVKVFVYKIPQKESSPDHLFLKNTSFVNQLCSVGGNFEVILSDLGNPILALNSFYSFTAALHVEVANYSADYSINYPEYDQINGDITTVSKPVFGADGKLLGVAGITIYIDQLGNLTDTVKAAMLQRSLTTKYDPANFVLSSADCSLQTEWSAPCPDVAIPAEGGFCAKTDMKSSIHDLTCCGACINSQPPPPPQPESNSLPKFVIPVSVTVSVVAIIIIIIISSLWVLDYRRRIDETQRIPDFPSTDEGREVELVPNHGLEQNAMPTG